MKANQVSLLLAAALSWGCASVDQLATDYDGPEPTPINVARQFCYERAPVVDKVVLLKEGKSYNVFEVTMEASLDGYEDDSPITFEFYEQKGSGPFPVSVLLPILNGQKDLLRPFASHFAKNGYSVIIVDTVQRKTLLEDMIDPEPAIRQTVVRHRRVIDWVESRPGIDMSRLGVFGASLGGFNALFLAAFDDRVSLVSAALVGGSLADVLVDSTERRIVLAAEGARRELGFDNEQLRAHLRENIKTDTLAVAPGINADRVLMVLAKFDDAVPYERQIELREALGSPKAITLPTGHITAAAYLFYLRKAVLEFFDEEFAKESDHGTASLPAGWCA